MWAVGQVGACVKNTVTGGSTLWDFETLQNRVSLMNEMYQQALHGDLPRVTTATLADDPFYDPPALQLVGRASLSVTALLQEPYSTTVTRPVFSDKVCCVCARVC